MKIRILLIGVVLLFLSFNLAYACIFPDKTELFYPMNIAQVEKNIDRDFEKIDGNILIDYDSYRVVINKNSMTVECKVPIFRCVDNKTYRKILEDLENWNAYDLSKEDKDTIASLFGRNVIIRKLEKIDVLRIKIKSMILRFIGKLFCVSYENIVKCKNNWCSLKLNKSESCIYALQKCVS
jgi:hypothetical protein